MLINLNTSLLNDCLDLVEKALPSRTTIPHINSILLEIREEELYFFSTNLEMSVSVSIDYTSSQTGKILLPPKIVEIIRCFTTDEVSLEIHWENYKIDIFGGSVHFTLYGANSQDYPETLVPDISSSEKFVIEGDSLKKCLKSVLFSASTEETRPAFNGVLFTFLNNSILITASDTYRLAIQTVVNSLWNFEESRSLVPSRTLKELLRVLGEKKCAVNISRYNNILAFDFEKTLFTTRLLEEKYPNVSAVIPSKYTTRIIVDRKKFEHTVSRAALLAEGKNQAFKISLAGGQLEATVSGQEGSMEEKITVEQDGSDLEILVNTRYLLDFLRVAEESSIVIDFHGGGGPLIFRFSDNNNYLYLVLPIKRGG